MSRAEPPAVVGMAEISEIAGVSTKTVAMWAQMPGFPPPRELAQGRVWSTIRVRRWIARRRGDPVPRVYRAGDALPTPDR